MADGPSSSTGNGDSNENGIWRGLKSLIFGEDQEESLRDQLEEAIDRHEGDPGPDAKGDLTPLERQMVRNLLHFGERDAGDVGVPRADIIAVEERTTFDHLVQIFAEAGHSRLPVYRETLDSIIGMVHIKDVFNILATGAEHPATIVGLIRDPLYVPMSRGALDLLADMRQKRVHLAVVLDEYSGTEGLVTIEDLIEEIVGEIEDEHDEAPQAMLVPLDGGAWDADARVGLEEVGRAVDPALEEAEDDVDTLGGLTAVLAGQVPPVGTCIDHPSGWRIEVTKADERRIHRLRLHPAVATAEE
ncbi:transporter associated domain protein [Sphingomonas sp. S17]|uniref:HlyC/CorC family transporter n=2 Tax=Sphingomonas paucimobilis TaxID=13689 RepID=A0A411LM50_SPHPI|nr:MULTISPECIES: hemolysin family protein [Sphingomonas]EGI53334.1 transporter associated domain protein [Sphingomonas sp. S17]MBQ1479279.1 HlyC/CorC family transporter [Sphingomonas sp.]MCM3679955.1 hemolysin family protein [Sphingomonas paucimobilis]MDG5970650.1 hemolysin family protein [Sphingomonas paucimobilis]NNG59083.1 HlyC/CorC family transporter [Sphingomonas paucimobilis]